MTIVCPACNRALSRNGDWQKCEIADPRPIYFMCPDCHDNGGRSVKGESTMHDKDGAQM